MGPQRLLCPNPALTVDGEDEIHGDVRTAEVGEAPRAGRNFVVVPRPRAAAVGADHGAVRESERDDVAGPRKPLAFAFSARFWLRMPNAS